MSEMTLEVEVMSQMIRRTFEFDNFKNWSQCPTSRRKVAKGLRQHTQYRRSGCALECHQVQARHLRRGFSVLLKHGDAQTVEQLNWILQPATVLLESWTIETASNLSLKVNEI